MEREDIGMLLKKVRLSAGYNLKELATKVGISTAFLSQLENGRRTITIDFLIDFCTALNISVVDFFSSNDLAEDEIQILQNYRKLNDEDKGYVRYIVTRLSEQ